MRVLLFSWIFSFRLLVMQYLKCFVNFYPFVLVEVVVKDVVFLYCSLVKFFVWSILLTVLLSLLVLLWLCWWFLQLYLRRYIFWSECIIFGFFCTILCSLCKVDLWLSCRLMFTLCLLYLFRFFCSCIVYLILCFFCYLYEELYGVYPCYCSL